MDGFDPNLRISTVSSYSLSRQQIFRSPAAVSMVIKIPLQHLSGKGHTACTAADLHAMQREGCAGSVRRVSEAMEPTLYSVSDFHICLSFETTAEQGAEKSSRKISCNLGNTANAPPVT